MQHQQQHHHQTTLYTDTNDNYIIPLNYANNNRFLKNSANVKTYSETAKYSSPSINSNNKPATSQSIRSRSNNNRSGVVTNQSKRSFDKKSVVSSQSLSHNNKSVATNNNNNDFRTSSRTVSSIQNDQNDRITSSISLNSPAKSNKQESKSMISKTSLILNQLNTNDLEEIKLTNDDVDALNQNIFLNNNDFNPTMTTIMNNNDEQLFLANDIDLKDDISLLEIQHELNLSKLKQPELDYNVNSNSNRKSSVDKYFPSVNSSKANASPVKSMKQAFKSPSLNDFYYCDPFGDEFMKELNEINPLEYRPHEDFNIKSPNFNVNKPPNLTTVHLNTVHLNSISLDPTTADQQANQTESDEITIETSQSSSEKKSIEKSSTKNSFTSITRRVFNRFAKPKATVAQTSGSKVAPLEPNSPKAKVVNNQKFITLNKSYKRENNNFTNRSLNNINQTNNNKYTEIYSHRMDDFTTKSCNHLSNSSINKRSFNENRCCNNNNNNKSHNCSTLKQPRMRFDKYKAKDVFLNSSTVEPPPAPPKTKSVKKPLPKLTECRPIESQYILPVRQPILIKDKVLTPDYMETRRAQKGIHTDTRTYNKVQTYADVLWFESMNDRQYEYFMMHLPELTEESSFVGQSKFDWISSKTPEYTFYKLFKPNSPLKRIREN